MFPIIKEIDDVRRYVGDHPNFVFIEGDCGNTYVDYVVQGDDTFPHMPAELLDLNIRRVMMPRECRGIAFSSNTGYIVSRPFHKFFNLGERPETLFDALDWSKPFQAQVKLDGSMVRPIRFEGEAPDWEPYHRLATRKGITDVACEAELYSTFKEAGSIQGFCHIMWDRGCTPIFEWVAPNNRIVLKYDEPQLVLLGVRELQSGNYLSYQRMQDARFYDIPIVPLYEMNDPAQEIEALRAMEGMEGVVLVFQDGTRVKVKTDWYAGLHRVKSRLARERDVVGMVMENTIDDALQLLTPDMRADLTDFQNRVIEVIGAYGADVRRDFEGRRAAGTRKDFAIGSAQEMHPIRRAIIFAAWDGKDDLDNIVRSMLQRHLGSNQMFRKVRDEILANLPDWDADKLGEIEL